MRALLALVPLLPASPTLAQSAQFIGGNHLPANGSAAEDSADVDTFGVLRPIGLLCTAFESDAGEVFVLDDRGGFQVGDRVHVRGSVSGPGVCGSLIVSRLDNTIDAAFAGTGTLVADRALGVALETPEGARYKLVEPHGFPLGEDVFVRGVVRARRHPITGQVEHWIFDTVIGTAFTGYGRLAGGFGTWNVELEDDTTLRLDHPGYAYAAAGDFVFVEGFLDLATDPPTLCHNTARRAFAAPGEIVDVGGGAPGFKAETVVFDDLFSLVDFGAFGIGERGFVRGRKLDDYDPLEVRGNLIRGSRLDEEFSACGTIVADVGGGGTGVSFRATSGETFELETLLTFATEPFVFVAGAVDATGTRFEHNLISRCIETFGTLQHGFECTPLFVAGGGSEGTSFLLLENLGPYWVGDSFCVLGGLMVCDIGCPVPCLMANDVNDCSQ